MCDTIEYQMYTKLTHIFQTKERVVVEFNKINAGKKQNFRSVQEMWLVFSGVQEMWLVFSGKSLNNFCSSS